MKIIDKISNYEWEMLLATNSEQPHVDCKDDKYTFFLMRRSQWSVYPLEIQAAYLCDIHEALRSKRNLMVEKYAYMMSITDPEKFEGLKHRLPTISEHKLALIKELLDYHVKWYGEAKSLLPTTMSYGRNSCDVTHQASIFTYLTGEMSTYSEKTLTLLIHFAKQVEAEHKNLVVEIYKKYVDLQ